MTTDDMQDRLWALGDAALAQLATQCSQDEPGPMGILSAQARLAGTFSLMAVHKENDTSRGLRLMMLLMFESDTTGQDGRVSLAAFIAGITGERADWVHLYGLPPRMNRWAWSTLYRLMRDHIVGDNAMFALHQLNPDMTSIDWRRLAERLQALPIMEAVLY